MKELRDMAQWLDGRPVIHPVHTVQSLPSPDFRMEDADHVSFSSNNYLGLALHPRVIARAREGLERYGVGNCESRLMGGDLDIYGRLESRLASLKGKDTALTFATGYLTNMGVLPALVRSSQVMRAYGYRGAGNHTHAFFADEYSHISIREGIRLSGADRMVYRHGDLGHLAALLAGSTADTKIIVTDGVFSQDGDIAPLPDLLTLAARHDATVYVDDAHGTGVLGATGAGITEHFGVADDRLICMGTLSKAYGAIGGFIATERYIGDLLRLTCSAYGFTSALPPDQVLALIEAIDIVHEKPELRERLWENQRHFVSGMAGLPYHLIATTTPIIPILIGDEALTDRYASILHRNRLHVDSVKFPAVAKNQGRLRVLLNAGHTRDQIDHLVAVLKANQHLLSREASLEAQASLSQRSRSASPA